MSAPAWMWRRARSTSASLRTSIRTRSRPLLTEGAQRWLAPYSWEQPPELKGEVSLVLPAWTNRQPDWRAEVQPTLRLQGEFKIEHGGAYRGRAGHRRPIAHLVFESGLAPA